MRFHLLMTALAILGAAGVGQPLAAQPPVVPAPADLLKHGDYLVNRAVMCSECHSPRDAGGQFDLARLLQGMVLPVVPKQRLQEWAERSPNITASGLAGSWTEGQLVRFLMTGTDPDGKQARPPMPAFRFSAFDAQAIAVYLKSLPGKPAAQAIPVAAPPRIPVSPAVSYYYVPAASAPAVSYYYVPATSAPAVSYYYAPATYYSPYYAPPVYYASYYYSPPVYYAAPLYLP